MQMGFVSIILIVFVGLADHNDLMLIVLVVPMILEDGGWNFCVPKVTGAFSVDKIIYKCFYIGLVQAKYLPKFQLVQNKHSIHMYSKASFSTYYIVPTYFQLNITQ